MTKKRRSRIRYYYLICKYKIQYKRSNPLYNKGIHIIEAPAGTGKTLLANMIVQKIVDPGSYMYCNIAEFDTQKVITIDINTMFCDGEQRYKLDTHLDGKRCKGLIIDEINANFNRRLNNRKLYNDVFVGLMEFVVTARHQGIERIYFIGQDLSLQDGQLQQVIKYRHLVYANKKYNYELYKDTGNIALLPKRLKIIHQIKQSGKDPRGMPIFTTFKVSKMDVDYDKHIKTYNHKGYADKYNTLPILPIKS